MINGITYYKLKSPYNGDVTKNCSVSGIEIDNNFFTLEGRDVKSITVDGTDIVLNLLNGEQLKAVDVLDNFITNISFDKENGILKTYRNNGEVEVFDGFVSIHEHNNHKHLDAVASNETLTGNGTHEKPLKLAEAYKTGQFKPVDKIVTDKKTEKPFVGERVLVSEERSAYGLLYNYSEVIQIACELDNTHSKWRIPSKADWDDMLNAVEPCTDNKNHDKSTPDRYLGKWAGKLLKSKYYWKDYEGCECDCKDDEDEEMDGCHCGKHRICKPTYCGEFDTCHFKAGKFNTQGIDKYGFTVLPSGYTDDGGIMNYFGERACFWTSTNMEYTNIFTKRFEYNSNKVYQGIVPAKCRMSLRLVKDYTGDNYTESENILGQNYPTVLMPSVKNGKAVWTSINIYYTSPRCKGCHCGCNCMNDNLDPTPNPNDILIKKYYIDEWNGFKWLRNEFKEGDSVVVKNAPNGKVNAEYRIVEGNLIAVEEVIYNNVIDTVNDKLKEIDDKIAAEISRSVSEDTKLSEKITHVETTLSDFAQETNKAFGIINDNLIQSINTINNAIQTEHDERQLEDAKINTEIDSIKKEASTHVKYTDISTTDNPERKAIILKNHDTILGTDTNGSTYNLAMLSKWDKADFGSNKIEFNINSSERPTVNDTEKISYISDLENLSENCNNEIEKLKSADLQLQQNIDEEANTRQEKDTQIESKLLTSEGTVFNTETGILTLKSKGGDNDIEVQFTMNFGNF